MSVYIVKTFSEQAKNRLGEIEFKFHQINKMEFELQASSDDEAIQFFCEFSNPHYLIRKEKDREVVIIPTDD